jgi:putative transposase
MDRTPDLYRCRRFLGEIIAHAVWSCHTFSLSFRDVELLLAERGVVLSCESLRRWCLKFGGGVAACLRRRRTRPGDAWHLDEVVLRINCVPH